MAQWKIKTFGDLYLDVVSVLHDFKDSPSIRFKLTFHGVHSLSSIFRSLPSKYHSRNQTLSLKNPIVYTTKVVVSNRGIEDLPLDHSDENAHEEWRKAINTALKLRSTRSRERRWTKRRVAACSKEALRK